MVSLEYVKALLRDAFPLDLEANTFSIDDFLEIGRHLALGWRQVEKPELDRSVAARSALTLALVAGAIIRRSGPGSKGSALIDSELAFLCAHLEYLSAGARWLVYPMALEALLTAESRGEGVLGHTVVFGYGVEWLRSGQLGASQQCALLAAWTYLACLPETADDDATARALLWTLLMTDTQNLPSEVTDSLQEVCRGLSSGTGTVQLRSWTELTPSDIAGWLEELAESAGIKAQDVAWAQLTPASLAERLRMISGGNPGSGGAPGL